MEFANNKVNGCKAMCVSIYGIEQDAVKLGLMNIDKKGKNYLDLVIPGTFSVSKRSASYNRVTAC